MKTAKTENSQNCQNCQNGVFDPFWEFWFWQFWQFSPLAPKLSVSTRIRVIDVTTIALYASHTSGFRRGENWRKLPENRLKTPKLPKPPSGDRF